MQLHFTFTRNPQFLSEEDVYAITPVHDPAELLKEGYALCLVWRPKFDGNTVPLETLRGVWHKPDGGEQDATLYFMQDRAEVQSRTKNALDRRLKSPYLFAAWKKDGQRLFKIIHNPRVRVQSDSLADILPNFIEGRFEPRAIYRRKHSIMTLIMMDAKRRKECKELRGRLLELLEIQKRLKD